ncbi:hypothetical protein JOC75_002906 [Metabacillus crassostreae]|nr:hypothetical protein [Metabacillus crassostreae]
MRMVYMSEGYLLKRGWDIIEEDIQKDEQI